MIPHSGALVLAVDNPEELMRHLPIAKQVRHKGRDLVIVKHNIDSTKVLRNMGLKAPTPMLHDGYDWPGMHNPMQHQVTTADFITMHQKLFVLNGTGTGKTASAIWAADYLMARGIIDNVCVVCPLSVTGVWEEEIFKVAPHRTYGTMTGSRARRLKVLDAGHDFSIINFEGLTALVDVDKKKKKRSSPLKGRFTLYIIDEASAYRNAGTDRYEALKYLSKDARLWMLTATPTPNAPTDAWALTRLVSPGNVPDSFKLFRETVMFPAGPYKWVARMDANDKVRQVMQPAIRFEKKDCLDLPPITYNPRYVELTPEQKEAFESMRKRLKFTNEDNSVAAANSAVKMLKLIQICCGVVKDDNQNPVYLDCTPRLNLVQELVENNDQKSIVFAPFIFSMEMIRKHLEDAGIDVALVNGDTPNAQRKEIFAAFQRNESPRVLIAHPKVAAHGLTLTRANSIIWYAPIYSLEQYEQACARIERQGQKHAMTVYNIASTQFELGLYETLKKHGNMQQALLDMYRDTVESA